MTAGAQFLFNRGVKRTRKRPKHEGPGRYQSGSGWCSGFQRAAQHFHVFGDLTVGRLQLFDALDPMHDRGVIAPAEPATNLRQGPAGQLFAQIHRHLTRAGIRPQAFGADDV